MHGITHGRDHSRVVTTVEQIDEEPVSNRDVVWLRHNLLSAYLGVVATTDLFPVALFFTTCSGRDHATFCTRTLSILAQFFRCTKGHFSHYSRVRNFGEGGSPLGFSLLKFCSIF